LLFVPSGTARDNYFTVDAAWIAANAGCKDWLEPVYSVPQGHTLHDLAERPLLRIRASCLWRDAPERNTDAFEFSTASTRYHERVFALAKEKVETSEEVAGRMFQELMEEEERLTPEQALEEVGPAVSSCLELVRAYVLPFFECANECAQHQRNRA
jgi:hypothetical protein